MTWKPPHDLHTVGEQLLIAIGRSVLSDPTATGRELRLVLDLLHQEAFGRPLSDVSEIGRMWFACLQDDRDPEFAAAFKALHDRVMAERGALNVHHAM